MQYNSSSLDFHAIDGHVPRLSHNMTIDKPLAIRVHIIIKHRVKCYIGVMRYII